MSDRSRNSDILTPRSSVLAIVATLTLAFSGWSSAFELGHSRVTSAPGQPLAVVVPVTGLTAAQEQSLNVSIADSAQWQAAGLTPPVALDSLRLSIGAGRSADSRVIEIRSAQVSQLTVIDLLLNIRTDDASRTVQTSVIVPPPPQVRLASGTVTVQRGDTLIGIANQFPVSGATLYQRLWAIYSANPRAFIDQNMNLLRSGASLTIPDDATVRAVDPAFARAQYLEHVRAFRQRRGGGQGDQGIAAQAAPAAAEQAGADTARGEVEPASSTPPVAVRDQVRVTAAEQDQATAQAKAAAEERDRTAQLEQNVQALRGAIAQASTPSSAAAAQTDSAGTPQDAVDAARSDVQQTTDAAKDAVEGATRDAAAAGQGAVDTARSDVQQTTDAVKDAVEGAARDAAAAGQGAVDAARSDVQQAADAAKDAVEGAARDAAAAGQGAVDTTRNDVQQAADAAKDAVEGAARDAVTAGQGAADAAQTAVDEASKQASNAANQAGASLSQQAEQAQTIFQRAGQWIQNNVAAALALLLALIALILAWILRAKKAATGTSQATQQRVDQAASNFEEKLKEIDLSLDSDTGSRASTDATSQKDKPTS